MAEDASSGVQTRRIDSRYHFVSERIEEGLIKIVIVKSCENVAGVAVANMKPMMRTLLLLP
jgi:hypothetical protein